MVLAYKGPPLDSWPGGGGAGVIAWPFFYFPREMERFFSPQDRLYFH